MTFFIHIPCQELTPLDEAGRRSVTCKVSVLDRTRGLGMVIHNRALVRLGDFSAIRVTPSRRVLPDDLNDIINLAAQTGYAPRVKIDPSVYAHLLRDHPDLCNRFAAQGQVQVSDDLYLITIDDHQVSLEFIPAGTTTHTPIATPILGVYRAVSWRFGSPFQYLQPGPPEWDTARAVIREYLDARWNFRPLPARLVWSSESQEFQIPWQGGVASLAEEFANGQSDLPARLIFKRPACKEELLDVSAPTTVPPGVIRQALAIVREARHDSKMESRPVPT